MRREKKNWWFEALESSFRPSRKRVELNPFIIILLTIFASFTLLVLPFEYLVPITTFILIISFFLLGKKDLINCLMTMMPFLIIYLISSLAIQVFLGFFDYRYTITVFTRMFSMGLLGLVIIAIIDTSLLIEGFSIIYPKVAVSLSISMRTIHFTIKNLNDIAGIYKVNYRLGNGFRDKIRLAILLSRSIVNMSINNILENAESLYTRYWLFSKRRET